jgi:hypothetical protein
MNVIVFIREMINIERSQYLFKVFNWSSYKVTETFLIYIKILINNS